VLDPAKGLLYRINHNGELAADGLADGKTVFLYLPSRGDVFSRTLIDRRGDRILIGGTERQLAPLDRGPQARNETLLEILDVPDPIQTTGLKSLKSGTVSGMLQLPTADAMFGVSGDTIVAATPGHILVLDWDLGVRLVLDSQFPPVLMSLDEAARIYLVVRLEKTWGFRLVNTSGESLYMFEAPPGMAEPTIPPIVAYDHSAYLICGQQILAFGPDGKLNWNRAAVKTIAGAFVAPDGRLVATEGDSIVAWTPLGERIVLFAAGGVQFRTPPILASSGELLAASASGLYCVSAVQGPPASRP
jgi:hypothetical protein